MAKHRTKPRPDKRVLARQDIVRKGKGSVVPSPKPRSGGPGFARDVLAVFAFVGAIGLLCALWTYRREDGLAFEVENLIGPMGHQIASGFFGLFGVCAFLAPVALFYTAVALFVRGRGKRRGRQIAGLVVLAVSGTVLAHLAGAKGSTLAYPPGGAVGAALAESLRGLFSTVGSVLVAIAVAACGLIVVTDSAFARLCVAAGSFSGRAAGKAFHLAVAEAKRQVALWRERRARRLQEKAEEEAAFAQMLADAEARELEGSEGEPTDPAAAPIATAPAGDGTEAAGEPTEDELAASEADALADEAARLAFEAEERQAQQAAEEQAREAALRAARRARAMLPNDPAWAMGMAEPAEPGAAPAPEEKARPQPLLSLPPGAEQASATVAPLPSIPAGTREEPLPVVGPVLPVIVEPKDPPKPTKSEKKDPFAFEGTSNFALPPLSLLERCENQKSTLDKDSFFSTAEKLREKLASFGIDGAVKEIRPGPVVTMYEFEPAPGIKISKIASLADDLAMAMEALKVRIVAPIPGKGVVGIEVPNKTREHVFFREIAEQDVFANSPSKIALAIGKNIEGMPYITDLAKMPHMLIAGTTGSGKSVSVNAMIMSILFKATPEEVRMIMVDPKVTELSIYEGIPHLLLPVVTDARKAALALRWAVEEMERRYQLLADAGVRNLSGYNKWIERSQGEPKPAAEKPVATSPASRRLRIIDLAEGESEEEAIARADGAQGPTLGVAAPDLNEEPEPTPSHAEPVSVAPLSGSEEDLPANEKPRKLPYIVIVIDEIADLMMVASREVETYVTRLAQMARAAGIHLMVATQRPSTDVITGVIKANFPARISFQLRSKPDSMTILGTTGAEALLGMGDMLILPPTSAHLERVHGAFVSDQEIQKVVDHLKTQGKPVYDESILRPRDEESEEGFAEEEQFADEMYDQCLALVSEMRLISVSMLQRKLRLGYNRAARIIERMEREGIVGPANGSRPREVLIRPVGQMSSELNV